MTETAYVVLYERTRRDTKVVTHVVGLDPDATRAAARARAEEHAAEMDVKRAEFETQVYHVSGSLPMRGASLRQWQRLTTEGNTWDHYGSDGDDEWWVVYPVATEAVPTPETVAPAPAAPHWDVEPEETAPGHVYYYPVLWFDDDTQCVTMPRGYPTEQEARDFITETVQRAAPPSPPDEPDPVEAPPLVETDRRRRRHRRSAAW